MILNNIPLSDEISNGSRELFTPVVPKPLRAKPGPPTLLHQIRSTIISASNPLAAIREAAYEDPVLQTRLFGEDLTLVSDPDYIKYLFVSNHSNYKMHRLRQLLFRPILRNGLVAAEGSHWKQSRKTLAPLFSLSSIASFASGMRQTIENELPNLIQQHTDSSSATKVSDLMSSLTFAILSDTLFSGDISSDSEDILRLVATVLSSLGRPSLLDLAGAPNIVPRLGKISGQRAVKRLRKLITQTSHQRIEKLNQSEHVPEDFLTKLLTSTDENGDMPSPEEIEDQMVTFIGAGHETTAQAMAWLLYLLSNDRQAQDQVKAEVDALDINVIPVNEWAKHIPWSMACFEEALRLFPPASILYRTAQNEDQFKDTQIPAGSGIMLHLWILHRHKKHWKHPNSFDPLRFYGKNRDNIGKYQFLPFGVGHRVCIGARFAMTEAAVMIVSLMRNYRFEYVTSQPPKPVIKLSLQPHNAMPMKITLR